jgi:hypothetical protein
MRGTLLCGWRGVSVARSGRRSGDRGLAGELGPSSGRASLVLLLVGRVVNCGHKTWHL